MEKQDWIDICKSGQPEAGYVVGKWDGSNKWDLSLDQKDIRELKEQTELGREFQRFGAALSRSERCSGTRHNRLTVAIDWTLFQLISGMSVWNRDRPKLLSREWYSPKLLVILNLKLPI